MPRREDPLNYDLKLKVAATTWLPEPLAKRMDDAAHALGWTNSQLLRWALGQTIERAEKAGRRRHGRNGTT